MKRLLVLLVLVGMFSVVATASADDIKPREVVKQAANGILIGSTTGDTGTLLVETKVGDYYQITMKDGNFLDCKRIQKKAYVEWQANYANK